MLGGPGDASLANANAGSRGQEDVDHADSAEFGKHAAGFVAQSDRLAPLSEGLPHHVCQEADEDVGEDGTSFTSRPSWT